MGDPFTMKLMKNLVTPTFQGTNEDWPRFVIEWAKYIAKLSINRNIADQEKLLMLELCLDAVDKRELQFQMKAAGGREIPFQDFWTKLVDRYGEDIKGCARWKWGELALPNSGRLGVTDWRDFKIKFMDILQDIPGAGAEKAIKF